MGSELMMDIRPCQINCIMYELLVLTSSSMISISSLSDYLAKIIAPITQVTPRISSSIMSPNDSLTTVEYKEYNSFSLSVLIPCLENVKLSSRIYLKKIGNNCC